MRHHDENDLERRARRRAGMKMGWAIHLLVYLVVNTLLAALSVLQGRHWAIYPALGWGVGLAVHGLVVLLASSGWTERLVEAERRKLREQGDPW